MTNAHTNDELMFLARISEKACRYEEMRFYISSLVSKGYNLHGSERQLFSMAYRECINVHRKTWRTLNTIESCCETEMVSEYKESLLCLAGGQIKAISHELLNLLSNNLLPTCGNQESKVYYLKMEGDYKRYIAEISSGEEHARWSEETHESYKAAADLALSFLKPMDPTRLGLFMNFSVFYYEVYNSPERACVLAKAACDEALDGGLMYAIKKGMDTEEEYLESAEIVRLIQGNLCKWAARLVAAVK